MRIVLSACLLGALGCGDQGFGPPPPEPPCPALPPVDDVGFVAREGSALVADGRPFRALGANLYYLQQLFTYALGGDEGKAAPALAALDLAVCMGMSVVRISAFNDDAGDPAAIRPQPGLYREEGLRGLDRAVTEARRRGLRLILVLANYHEAYGGLPAYARWAGRGGRDDFFADATMQGYWKEWASTLLERVNPDTGLRYRDEPAIFAWEIANELRCPPCRGTTRATDTIAALAHHLRAAGARQLIGDGSEGFDDAPELHPGLSNRYAVRGEVGMSFSRLIRVPDLDLLSFHLYPQSWGLNPDSDSALWIDRHIEMARAAGKVGYLGEFGYPVYRDRARAAVYDAWLDRLFRERDGSLGLLWQLIPPSRRQAGHDDGYGVVPSEDPQTAAALYAASRGLPPAAPD
jgi:mannan endo-1,4-beta-mannosidase